MVTVTLTTAEARGMIWHLENAQRRGINIETERGMQKLKKAVKDAEPLFADEKFEDVLPPVVSATE